MKQYKTVPGPQAITVKNGKTDDAFKSFASIINAEAAGGWSYHSMQNITVIEKAGCIFGKPTEATYYMLIFVKEI